MKKITIDNLGSPETMRDVVGFYKKLVEQQQPLIRIDDYYGMGPAWIAWRHDDVITILKDSRFIKDMRKFTPQQEHQGAAGESTSMRELIEWQMNMPNMLEVDPPDHTRLRRLTAKAFTPGMIENLRPRILEIADELLDKVEKKGKMDLISDFAFPLPITVISEMLGIPARDRDKIRDLTHKIVSSNTDPSQYAVVAEALKEYVHYVKSLLNEKHKHPCEDIISALVHAHEQEDKLSENELLSTIMLLIVAGHETTTNLIGNGMLALLQYPEQMQLLRDNPSLLPSAIEELLRFAGPVMYSNRFAGEDITMHGKLIRKGEMVFFSLATANFDPQKFSNSEALDITRKENEHLAFGKGIHHCLGAPLARLEGQIAFGTLLKRLPNLRLDIEPENLVYNTGTIRSLSSVPLVF
ncbi:cytochrome P450 family protein [Bacillus gaemokensis]|uniref:Cytochrome P450 n=1 Tax=Bacillus gaemokensis TaxID=574375 RepID=A0A073KDW2_9BACI|nr:cytochrome P450 [Bacillus gaemokensis]KEK24780.1 cytochrome P450 [Bacillus gaemokensis]KYG36824.1 cytochrome P450 [Bacillus gaemokensis]